MLVLGPLVSATADSPGDTRGAMGRLQAANVLPQPMHTKPTQDFRCRTNS
jgi:hypothetical protein